MNLMKHRTAKLQAGLILCLLCVAPLACNLSGFECRTAADCGTDKMCARGWCQASGQLVCQPDGTCPPGHSCTKGVCLAEGNPLTCTQSSDCKRGYRCAQSSICEVECKNLPQEEQASLGRPCQLGNSTCLGIYICNPEQKRECVVDGSASTSEVCDDKDNDCDGQIDEDFPDKNKSCAHGTGECKREGTYVCKGDKSGLRCDPPQGVPAPELCDDKDNDCDGQIDEDFPDKDQLCTITTDGCKNEGTYVCKNDLTGLRCTAPTEEVCDTKDNDCDGQIDETLTDCVLTFAGNGIPGFRDGPRTSARFNAPAGLAFDAAGNLYVADRENHRIRKIDKAGQVTTFAGSGRQGFQDGPAMTAQFYNPSALAFDQAGNLYITDRFNHRIRKIDTAGQVTTFSGSGKRGYKDGSATEAQFSNPVALAFDAAGHLYVADMENQRVRKLDPSGATTTLTDGALPMGLAFDTKGNLYVASNKSSTIRKIDSSGKITELLPFNFQVDGSPLWPSALVWGVDSLYIAGLHASRLYKMAAGKVVIYAGSEQQTKTPNGPVRNVSFRRIGGLAMGPENTLYIADNASIRKIRLK